MAEPNTYQPVHHDQVTKRLASVVEHWQTMIAEAEEHAAAEAERRATVQSPSDIKADE